MSSLPPSFPRSLFALSLVMLLLGVLELAILYRYLGARDHMLAEAEYFAGEGGTPAPPEPQEPLE